MGGKDYVDPAGALPSFLTPAIVRIDAAPATTLT